MKGYSLNSKMKDDIVISLKGITKTYKLYKNNRARLFEALHPLRKKFHTDFDALHGIDLEVRRGEVLGLVGRNGSGKSTLLKIISGVLLPNSGTIEVKGRVSALLELGSGMNLDFTGRENIYFIGQLLGYSKKEMEERVQGIIDFAELGEHIDQPVRTYSSGMKSRLAFGVNTSIEPDILILDEVLSVGDALFQRKAFARMESLIKDDKTTVLFVSHSEQNIMQICTKAILLNSGKKLSEASPKKIIMNYQKLLFSKKDKLGITIEEILNDKEDENKLEKNIESININLVGRSDYYLDNLVSKSKNIIKTGDNQIVEICLYDDIENKINNLTKQQVYKIRVFLEINIPGEYSISVTLRDSKGLILSGLSFIEKELGYHYFYKKNYYYDLEFLNLLKPGLYYFSAALYNDKKEIIFATRDITVFKVSSDNSIVGFVDLFNDKEKTYKFEPVEY